MSSERAVLTTILPPRSEVAREERHQLLRLYDRVRPSQGWASFIILLTALLIIGMSVSDGSWVPTPGLQSLLFWSALAGLALAKVRIPAIFLHPVGLALGVALVVWRALELAEETTIQTMLPEIWNRLDVWYEAATSNGISTDLLPFTLSILGMAWLLGYISSFFVFRNSNGWVTVVFGGVVILTNLSFLPNTLNFSSKFFIFTLLGMLLIVRLNEVRNEAKWRLRGVRFEMVNGWLTMHSAVWFGVAVMLLAAMLPLRVYVSRDLANLWNTARTPVASLEEDVARLLAGIPSRKNVPGRFFGKTIPFIGAISFGGETVFWANTEYPSYWLSNTYSEYTPQGWKAGETTNIEVGPNTVPPPRPEWRKQVSVEQSIQLNFDSDSFLAGGNLDWLSHDAVIETLRPKDFVIDLHNPPSDASLPADIQKVAEAIRDAGEPPQRFVESYISRLLPEDIVLNSVGFVANEHNETMVVQNLNVERKPSGVPEIVSWKFADRLPENYPYTMVSYVSIATDDDLRQAGTEYDSFITDHYLQLPASLPQRVRDKAAELTAGKDNPVDKAIAISDYLRGDIFTYSQDIEAPPRDADGVDYFLFETRTGYSDYFASSMVVLLRAVDVPARLAAGYAPGEYDPETGVRVVRDHDSHGWVQVFFPEYGWIDFEPTPRWPVHERSLNIGGPGSDLLPSSRGSGTISDPSEFLDPFSEIGFPGPGSLDGGGTFGRSFLFDIDLITIATRLGIVFGVVAAVWLLLYWIWILGLRGLSPVERAYTRMSRLGAIAGLRRSADQTPIEYAAALSGMLGESASDAQRIAWEFAATRYTGGATVAAGDGDSQEMEQAWRNIRGGLIARAFRRLLPGGNQR